MAYSIKIECIPSDTNEIEGSFTLGNDEQNRKKVEAIREALKDGNQWAWCCIRVVISDGNDESSVSIRATSRATSGRVCGCSYTSEQDFRQSHTFKEMKREAIEALLDLVNLILLGMN